MRWRSPRVWAAAVALAAVSGCGVRPTGILSAGTRPIANGRAATITVYLVKDSRLVPVVRPGLPGHPFLAAEQLAVPPTTSERALGLRTEVHGPLEAYSVVDASKPERQRSQLVVRPADSEKWTKTWSRLAMAQIACTAQAIPGIDRVNLWGAPDPDKNGWEIVTCDRFSDLIS
ncbi:hypothetical protein ACQPZP_15030 [Spirillospora sp. CA-142024]|uniref:hypothetical protein n=1 Tax=Spirillospora sp. CA-142024 TaxID=3240036 RepID=UPI003D8E74E6